LPGESVVIFVDSRLVNYVPPTAPTPDCNCSNCAVEIPVIGISTYGDGWPTYKYGEENELTIFLKSQVDICVSRATIYIGYSPRKAEVSVYYPTLAPVGVNTTVTILGSNFEDTQPILCVFENNATEATYYSSTRLSCPVPLSQTEPDTVALDLVDGTGNPPVTVGNFTYYIQPTLFDFSPKVGSANGQDVYLFGEGFFNSTSIKCRFGDTVLAESPATFVNSSTILCKDVSSNSKTGNHSVSVSFSENADSFITAPGTYLFTDTLGSQSPTVQPSPSRSTSPSRSASISPSPSKSSTKQGGGLPAYGWAAIGIVLVVIVILVAGCIIVVVRNRARQKSFYRDAESIRVESFSDDPDTRSRGVADGNMIPMHELKNLNQIEKGSFGVIYEATWRGTKIAVKKLPSNISKKLLNEFYQEADLMRSLRHPNILQYLGLANSGPEVCICMEFMERGSLYRILHSDEPDLPLPRIKSICMDTARGMTYLHQQHPPIIHRDLKSHNILVDKHWQVKLCDFGLSRITEQNQTMTACGTPSWTAPEVLRNERYTTKADVYGFGIVVWEIFSRSDPFPGMPPFQIVFAVGNQQLRPKLDDSWPQPWVDLITSCWSEDPDARPTFEEVLETLEKLPSE